MAFNRPTLATLITRIEGDFKSGFGLTTLVRRSFLKVHAKVCAGIAHLLFGYISYIERQAFPDTAEDEYLLQWAGIWAVEQKPATFAEFSCAVIGSTGVVIPQDRPYKSLDGVEYYVKEEVTLTGSNDFITLIAVLSGSSSAVEVGDIINIVSPIANLDTGAEVDEIIEDPVDLEDTEAMRARLLDVIRNPPSGGSVNDYIQWALSISGITRAWIGPQALGPGTVLVYVVSDDLDPITPTGGKITEVADYIETVRPVTATVTVVAPVLLELDITIAIDPNDTDTQEAIELEIRDLIERDSAVADTYKSPGVLNTGAILLSRLNEAISIALGESDHEIVEINGNSPANVVPATGELIVLGTITWQNLA